jgi:hypothetical protein
VHDFKKDQGIFLKKKRDQGISRRRSYSCTKLYSDLKKKKRTGAVCRACFYRERPPGRTAHISDGRVAQRNATTTDSEGQGAAQAETTNEGRCWRVWLASGGTARFFFICST